jgi:hypothetical protein
MYIICTTRVQHPSHMGWAPHIMGPTHVREVLYTCCTCGVRESPLLFFRLISIVKSISKNFVVTRNQIILYVSEQRL